MKLAFYKGRNATNPSARIFDAAVCLWTDGPYSHVELIVGGNAKAAMCCSSSYRDGGVRSKQIDLTTGHWDLVDIPAGKLSPRTGKLPVQDVYREQDAIQWFVDHEGEPYDVAGLFGFVLPWRTEDKRKWFCSEAVCAALGIAEAHTYSPNDLYEYLKQPRGSYA